MLETANVLLTVLIVGEYVFDGLPGLSEHVGGVALTLVYLVGLFYPWILE